MPEPETRTAPYASFRSVINFLDKMRETHPGGGLPQIIDRSYWGTWFSGGYGPQIVYALKFLNLIDSENRPNNALAELVHDLDDRPAKLRDRWMQHYRAAFALDLGTATMSQLEEVFRDHYGVTGDTRRKAIVFFLHGAEFAGLQIGSHLVRSRGVAAAKRKPGAGKRRPTRSAAPKPAIPGSADSDFTDLKRKYLEALIKRVEEGDEDADLLDRVQRLLFEQSTEADASLSRTRQPQSQNPETASNDGS
ncbi:MAG TPA: hypothetical protein VI409_07035 [Gaiellaceae bacterium]|nr:hypothetical protein [Gaiellaceae bacterium]